MLTTFPSGLPRASRISSPTTPAAVGSPASSTTICPTDRTPSALINSEAVMPNTKAAAWARRTHGCQSGKTLRWILSVLCFAAVLFWAPSARVQLASRFAHSKIRIWEVLRPVPLQDGQRDPEAWLRKHSIVDYDAPIEISKTRPRAAIISLVRNEELEGILQSMRQLEFHFNRRHNYLWLFFSEVAFSEDFKAATSNATSARTEYHLIPLEHWSTPSNISRPAFYDSLDYLGALGVGKGSLISYRHMCRWNSLFFYHHPALQDFDYYWRVEPDVHFFCHIPYDPFAFLAAHNLVYGFNMAILEDARSFPSLWSTTLSFVEQHPEKLHPNADLSWLMDQTQGWLYNNCQFFSNFEIGDLRFFRSEAVQAYLRYLDESGGFWYERFGDAPIHTLALALFAARDQVWFFRDVGYQHDATRHCPADRLAGGTSRVGGGGGERCACEPTGLDQNFYSLVPMESPQRKPVDTCVRSWLGGEWLKKKEGWKREVEMALGGDGYGGYVRG